MKEGLHGLYDLTVYVDGRFVSGEDAKISVWDHGLLYGDAVYDTARFYNGKPFRLKEHIGRLYDSAKGIDLQIPLSEEELEKIVVQVVKKNGLENAQVRIIVSRGPGPPGLDPSSCKEPTVIVSAALVPPMLGKKPLRLLISGVRKKSPISIDAKLKSVNYLDSVLAKIQAKKAGFDDAILLDSNGLVAEATGANIFVVKKGRVATPPTIAALAGITRLTIMELSRNLGYAAVETQLSVQDLYTADEIFLTGTGIDGVAPVAEVDGRRIGGVAPGSITRRLMEAYENLVLRG